MNSTHAAKICARCFRRSIVRSVSLLAAFSPLRLVVALGHLRSNIFVVEPAQDRHGQHLTDSLDRARDRRKRAAQNNMAGASADAARSAL